MTREPEAAEVCRDLYPRLVGALGLFCGDRTLAEDLAQEALPRLWERWCYQVGVNLARTAARRRAVEKVVRRRVTASVPAADSGDQSTQALVVKAALLALPVRQRQAVVSRHYLGLSVKQTARAMGCAPGTVTALTHQAIVTLRRSKLLAGADVYEDAEHGSS